MSDWRSRRETLIVASTPSLSPPIEADVEDEFVALARAAADPMLEGQALYEAACEILLSSPPRKKWDGTLAGYPQSDRWAAVGELYDRAKAFFEHPDATPEQAADGAVVMQRVMDWEADLCKGGGDA